MNMPSKDDNYWLGVRDALRMVDSFQRWSERNPEKAKSLQAFISEGLIAAAKRCEECLSKDLGLSFKADGTIKELSESSVERLPPTHVEETETPSIRDSFEKTPDISPAEPTSSMHFELEEASESKTETSVADESSAERSDQLPDIQSDAGLAPEEVDPTLNQPTRQFDADFSLGEPEALVIESEKVEEPPVVRGDSKDEEEPPEELDELEDAFSTHGLDVSLPKTTTDESESEQPTEFTWRDYESAISSEEVEKAVEDSEGELPEPPPESSKPEVWSPYDEPSVDDLPATEETTDEPSEPEDSAEEPPAPPPPESDETEDERRRRARRLFFGA